MSSLTFYLRSSRYGVEYPGRLCMRIIHHRRSKSLSTPYKLFRDEFINLKNKNGNDDLCRYIVRMHEIFDRTVLSFGNQDFEVEELMPYLLSPKQDSLTRYVSLLARRLESSGKERTSRAYRSALKRLSVFSGRKLSVRDIDRPLVESFERRLKEEAIAPNTISFYMRTLRAIYNKAIEDCLIPEGRRNPFKHVFTGFHKTEKRALSTEQMQSLQNLEYNRRLEQSLVPANPEKKALYDSWRMFIFCFHARGMSFVDLAYLRKSHIIGGGILRYYRKKTGGVIEVKVTPIMQQVIESFSREVMNSPYLFPLITRIGKNERLQYETALKRQNSRLKKLAAEVGIRSRLTTHVSRHSWASIAKNNDTPLWVISEGLGHASEKVTYTYLAGLERSRLDEASEAVCALVCKKEQSRAPNVKILG